VNYRILGKTDMRVSEIGFGCGGTAGLMINGSFEQQISTVARALELGVNYFDESPDYGDGVSEINLGKVLKELGVRPYITTKVEVRQENLSDIAGHVEKSVTASLERLGLDSVDVVQIHNGPTAERPNLEGRNYRVLCIEDYLSPGGAIEGLERVQRTSMTRYVGFICRGNDGGPVRQLIDTGIFSLINISYTLLNPTAVRQPSPGMELDVNWEQVLPYASEHGVGVAIYSPLAGGVLTDNAIRGGDPHPLANAGGNRAARSAGERHRALVRQAQRLSFLSSTDGGSLAQAATRFILTEPSVTTVLGGFSDVQQLEEAVGASAAGPLSQEQLERIERVWRNE
jgi:L-glyceraldehyde 3-phosphate reductase